MLDELKQSMSLNGSTEQTPEVLSFKIADLCEMKDSVVGQVNDLIAFQNSSSTYTFHCCY